MIDINKKYRTRSGDPVRIYATDGGGLWPVHGAILQESVWRPANWDAHGKYDFARESDLIEIDEKEELLQEAKRMYPKGTRFMSPFDNKIYEATGEFKIDEDGDVFISNGGRMITYNGKWAEIVKEHTFNVFLLKRKYTTEGYMVTENEDSTKSTQMDLLAKKTITFYEGEGL